MTLSFVFFETAPEFQFNHNSPIAVPTLGLQSFPVIICFNNARTIMPEMTLRYVFVEIAQEIDLNRNSYRNFNLRTLEFYGNYWFFNKPKVTHTVIPDMTLRFVFV